MPPVPQENVIEMRTDNDGNFREQATNQRDTLLRALVLKLFGGKHRQYG